MRHLLFTTLLAGCEQWHALDHEALELTGPAFVTVRVDTRPEAYPADPFGDAVRASFDGDGELLLLGEDREVLRHGPQGINVLDAWDDCPRDRACRRSFEMEIRCEAPCEGVLDVDAFQSTRSLRQVEPVEGAIAIDFPEVYPIWTARDEVPAP